MTIHSGVYFGLGGLLLVLGGVGEWILGKQYSPLDVLNVPRSQLGRKHFPIHGLLHVWWLLVGFWYNYRP
jgi:hypothetical protein